MDCLRRHRCRHPLLHLGSNYPRNVDQLQIAWVFHTGDFRGKDDPVETTYEVTPLKIDGSLYLCTPHDLVFALDAETGREKWRYDPKIQSRRFKALNT